MIMSLVFFHHIALFSCVLFFLNWKACWFRLSVLSTSKSILSPLSSTFSVQRRIAIKRQEMKQQEMKHEKREKERNEVTDVLHHHLLDSLNLPTYLSELVSIRVVREEVLGSKKKEERKRQGKETPRD